MGMVEWYEFQVPGKVICAEHCVDSVGMEMDRIGGSRALVVTDQGVEEAGLVQHVIDGSMFNNPGDPALEHVTYLYRRAY